MRRLYRGRDPGIGVLTPELAPVALVRDRIRITLDTASVPGCDEIDAVELVGTAP